MTQVTATVNLLKAGPTMATYVLVHGAGGSDSWYWHRVVPELQALGHDVVAPDLPIDDVTAGLAEFADVVVDAVGAPAAPRRSWPTPRRQ